MMLTTRNFFTVAVMVLSFYSLEVNCLPTKKLGVKKPKVLTWRQTAEYPHDTEAFTQGLEVWDSKHFLESVGQYGRSELRKVKRNSGMVVKSAALDRQFFGEGVTRIGQDIFQMTWREGFILHWLFNEKSGFVLKDKVSWLGEGWGITKGAGSLWVSDGTSTVREIDPKTFKQKRLIKVTLLGEEFDKLNELEFMNGSILANVFMSSTVVQINPNTGAVEAMLDLGSLVPRGLSIEAIANGLAWDQATKKLFVTGKYWPKVFELSLD